MVAYTSDGKFSSWEIYGLANINSDRKVKKHIAGFFMSDKIKLTINGDEVVCTQDDLSDQMWRINNLYTIINKEGKEIRFRPNYSQKRVLREITPRHCIPKSRQVGISTLIGILQLDSCIFNKNFKTLTIADTLSNAKKIFARNIVAVYERLPVEIKSMTKVIKMSHTEGYLNFSNGAEIHVDTSGRSDTFNFVHVSEFGVICDMDPSRAKEIVTGTFETTGPNQYIVIESTSKGGPVGYWYEITKTANNQKLEGRKLRPFQYGITFIPWYEVPEYKVSPVGIKTTKEHNRYFAKLSSMGINLTLPQKAFYISKEATLKENIKEEYPSYLEESFEVAVVGVYYSREMSKARKDGRIGLFKHNPAYGVYTGWDVGISDNTAIWFFQYIHGWYYFIDYVQDSEKTVKHYARLIKEYAVKKGYRYENHFGPHDISSRSFGHDGTANDTASVEGLIFTIVDKTSVAARINLVRDKLAASCIDNSNCGLGIQCLDNYKKRFNATTKTWMDTPVKNKFTHGADAIGMGIQGHVNLIMADRMTGTPAVQYNPRHIFTA